MKIKLFTHTDFDGIGCAILAKLAFGENVDIEYCNYDDVDGKVNKFFFSYTVIDYDYIFITDISVNEETAKDIDSCEKSTCCLPKVILLDHHKTAEHLNKYDWCKVVSEENGELVSGTRLFYNWLNEDGNYAFMNLTVTDNLVESVNRYDTWLFNTKYNDLEPKKWNDLLYIYGREKFINKIVDSISCEYLFELNEIDEMLLELNQEKIDKYIESKQKEIIKKEILGYNAGVVFAEQYHSEVGNTLAKNNQDLDFIVLLNPAKSTISYRTVKDIDLSEVAKTFGGGGHPKASGSPIANGKINNFIYDLFMRV